MADKHDILSVLQDVQSGALTPEDALLRLKLAPFEDLATPRWTTTGGAPRSGRGDLRSVQNHGANFGHPALHGAAGQP